ncbi:hypothetical protein Pint_15267 [Pistacia integerrima]|uniref:Uncharacterized protein n=1 Tax=Pistacia integerrima TaxID=434235 RepID=A0ACC0ZDQ9_9ROSI|nr:hypothetical protein Pint_15267 [Pistacia integerrima]
MGGICGLEEQTCLARASRWHACCLLRLGSHFLANASNLVLYLSKFLHFSPSSAANTVTNFMGTAFLLALLGGFLADAFFTTYNIYVISAVIEFMGLLLLTVQAQVPSLRPPTCALADTNTSCQEVEGGKAVMLFAGLYLVALGVGGIKGSLAPHGAEQFDETTQQGRKQRSAFFNYFVFCLSSGALIAVTFVVWVEDNKGWQWGFGISTATILLSIPAFLLGSPFYRTKIPIGSPITTIFKVLTAAIYNTCKSKNSSNAIMGVHSSPSCMTNSESKEDEYSHTTKEEPSQIPTESLKFLNRALINNSGHSVFHCTEKGGRGGQDSPKDVPHLHVHDNVKLLSCSALHFFDSTSCHHEYQARIL